MAIQIGKLRKWTPPNETEEKVFVSMIKGFHYNSLRELFANVEQDIPKFLSEKEQVNIFYTVAHHLEGKRYKSSWQAQDIIPFDLDGIDLDRIDEYPKIVADACGFDLDQAAIIYSGNGCHILVQVNKITDPDYIKRNKTGYVSLLDRIESACKEANLPFTKDSTAWDYARILRVPFTRNEKLIDGKTVIKTARLIQNNLVAQDWSIPEVEVVSKQHFMAKGSFPLADHKHIVNQCNFFKWLKDSPDEVHEPHAYAMLSITGHFTDNQEISKEYWDRFNSPSINSKELTEFTEQALRTAGPRTCEGIDELWGGCNECPHYRKVTSPVLLKDPDFIGTAHCGFSLKGPRGGVIRQYEDLRKYFQNDKKYIHIPEIKRLMVYNDGMYTKTYEDEIKGYAQKHFDPCVEKEEERKQFLFQVKSSPEEQKRLGFIHGAKNEGFMNLKNGVLNLKTKELLEHSPDYGFIYKLPYDYDAEATCPTWELLLNNLTMGRPELIDLIEEAIAYTVGNVPYTKFQHYFLLTGKGSNGKSTFINIFKMLLGSENTASIKLANLLTKEYYIAELEGKLANMVADEDPEAFEKKGADSSLLKALTGGDSVSARVIYEAPMQFVNRAKFFYAFNDIPKIGIKSHGDLRRPIIIPFDVNLDVNKEARISDVYKKIEPELSGILNRIVLAHDRLMSKGFTKTKYSLENIAKSRIEHDPVYDFMTNECEIKEGSFTPYSELYIRFDANEMYQNPQYKVHVRNFAKRVRNIIQSAEEFKSVGVSRTREAKGLNNICLKKTNIF